MKKKTKIIGILAAVFLVAGGYYFLFGKEKKEQYITEKVQKGDIQKTVSVTGSIVSEKPVGLSFTGSGKVEKINVSVGEEVVAGQKLAVLENEILANQLEKARLNLEKVVAESKTNSDSVREAEEKVDNAEDYLDAAEDYQDELVEIAELDYQNAVDYYEKVLDYYNKVVEDSGEESSAAKNAKMSLTQAENNKKKAEKSLETAKKNRELNLVSAENSLNSAEERLETIESEYAQKSRNVAVEAARADYEIAKKRMRDTSLTSPVNGIISKVNYEEGEVIGNAGNGVFFGEVISKDYIIEADIPESDISEIKKGQKAIILPDAFSEEAELKAEVIEIDPASTVIQEVVYYKTKLSFDPGDINIKEGMTADVEILIDKTKRAVKVSRRSVKEKNGEFFVEVINEEGDIAERKVEIGLKGDQGYVEIKSGLEAGEEIILDREEDEN